MTSSIEHGLESQVLVNFIAKLTTDILQMNDEPEQSWTLMVDGASNVKGSGIGVYLKSPNNKVIQQLIRLGFRASNNEVEYKTLIAGLRLARALGAHRLNVQSDS